MMTNGQKFAVVTGLCSVALVSTLCVWDVTQRRAPAAAPPAQSSTIRLPDGREVVLPPGKTLEFEDESENQGSTEQHNGQAQGTGAGLQTSADRIAQDFNATAPGSWLPGGFAASGGAASVEQTLTGGTRGAPLMWAGILCFLGAGAAFYFGLRRAALVAAGVGVALIAASLIPAWGWILIAVAGVGVVGVYVWAERKNLLHKEAVRGLTAAVESLPDDARKAFKSIAPIHLDDQDQATVRAIKKADDLPSERA